MAKKVGKRSKHVPQRTCVGCRETHAKRTLIRIVRTADGVMIDPTGKKPGRGAYIHASQQCWQRALKGPLAQTLKVTFSTMDLAELNAFGATLPDEDSGPTSTQSEATAHNQG